MERTNTFYFPSFESITLSDRDRAWENDLVHVTPEVVGVNVARMIEATTSHDALTAVDAMTGLQRAQRLVDQGETKEALPLLEAVFEADLANHQAISLLARCLTKTGYAEKAQALAKRIMDADTALEPLNMIALSRMALRHADMSTARHFCDMALADKPDGRQSLLLLGDVLVAEDRAGEAVDVYKRAIAVARIVPTPRFRLAQAYLQLGALEKAQLHAELTLDLDGRHQGAKKMLAKLEPLLSD